MKVIKSILMWWNYQIRKEYRKWILFVFLVFGLLFTLSLLDLNNFVLTGTGLAVFWYSIETFYLKQVQQKQLDHERKAIKMKRTIDLIEKFNNSVRLDFEYIMHPKFEFDTKDLTAEDYKYIIENKALPYEKMTPYLSLNNVLSFFEVSGLMVKNNLIDLNVYSDYFQIIIAKLLKNTEIVKIIEGAVSSDSNSWENVIKLHTLILNNKSSLN